MKAPLLIYSRCCKLRQNVIFEHLAIEETKECIILCRKSLEKMDVKGKLKKKKYTS
jgi:hypothetical protein